MTYLRRFAMTLLFILCSSQAIWNVAAQETPIERPQLDPKMQRVKQIAAEVAALDDRLKDLQAARKKLEEERAALLLSVAGDQAERVFQTTRFVVARVAGDQDIIVYIDGREQNINLAGILVKSAHSSEAIDFLKSQLQEGIVFVRMSGVKGDSAWIYSDRAKPSLNVQLVENGWAIPMERWGREASELGGATGPAAKQKSALPTANSTAAPTRSATGTDVQVRGYYRKDGTYVQPHTRSAPGTKKP